MLDTGPDLGPTKQAQVLMRGFREYLTVCTLEENLQRWGEGKCVDTIV